MSLDKVSEQTRIDIQSECFDKFRSLFKLYEVEFDFNDPSTGVFVRDKCSKKVFELSVKDVTGTQKDPWFKKIL